MAGERKGETYEALTALALEVAGYQFGSTAHWGKKPKGFSIDTDFLIGELNTPRAIILATSTTSAKNTPEKFWRNMGELFEAKRKYTPAPVVLNLVFEAHQMKKLQQSMTALADGELILQNERFGPGLIEIVSMKADKLPREKEKKLAKLRLLYEDDSSFRRLVKSFSEHLCIELKRTDSHLDPLWNAMRERKSTRSPAARRTFVRRGIAKLLIMPKSAREALLQGKRQGINSVPTALIELGIFRKSLQGPVLADEEVRCALTLLAKDDIRFLVERSLSSRPLYWGKVSAELLSSELSQRHLYVLAHFQTLCSCSGMHRSLLGTPRSGPRWLFWHVIEIIKATSGLRQGYGFAVLSQDVGYSAGISSGYKVLADWANGVTKTKVPKELIKDVAEALAFRMKQIGIERVRKVGGTIVKTYRENLLEQKIVAYVKLEPLPLLILRYLQRHYPGASRIKHSTLLGEIVGAPNQITTPVIVASKTLIHWKSAYDKGRNHKTKELSGRADALRFQWEEGTVKRRPTIERQILVVDGTFTDAQLASLISAGWDKIFYPDEMDKLVKAIV